MVVSIHERITTCFGSRAAGHQKSTTVSGPYKIFSAPTSCKIFLGENTSGERPTTATTPITTHLRHQPCRLAGQGMELAAASALCLGDGEQPVRCRHDSRQARWNGRWKGVSAHVGKGVAQSRAVLNFANLQKHLRTTRHPRSTRRTIFCTTTLSGTGRRRIQHKAAEDSNAQGVHAPFPFFALGLCADPSLDGLSG